MKLVNTDYDVIVVGGSYSGLAAGMALGRALKKILIIDNGAPCNRQTPYSHNFITQDGVPPHEIAAMARQQVAKYDTVQFFNGLVVSGSRTGGMFSIQVASGELFTSKKLVFATGIKDIMADIPGYAECWGISVLHCPYCHGYEVKNEKIGILGNGEHAYEMAVLISNWTTDLTVFTNEPSTMTAEQAGSLEKHGIGVVEKEWDKLEHFDGYVQGILFKDGITSSIKAIYTRAGFRQHCEIPGSLGCALTDDGYIKVDPFGETTVSGVFACGDNVTRIRAVANAVGMGTIAGITVSKKLIAEEFGHQP